MVEVQKERGHLHKVGLNNIPLSRGEGVGVRNVDDALKIIVFYAFNTDGLCVWSILLIVLFPRFIL